jgi:hypothetical protein
MQRRHFMRLGLAGSALLPSFAAGAAGALAVPETLRWLQLEDDRALPVAGAGDWLAVDVAVAGWQGDGLYLYPAWGSPRPYFVRGGRLAASEAALEFCDPASGQVLWRDTRQVQFAGRVQGRLPAQIDAWLGRRPELPLLQLPQLPA